MVNRSCTDMIKVYKYFREATIPTYRDRAYTLDIGHKVTLCIHTSSCHSFILCDCFSMGPNEQYTSARAIGHMEALTKYTDWECIRVPDEEICIISVNDLVIKVKDGKIIEITHNPKNQTKEEENEMKNLCENCINCDTCNPGRLFKVYECAKHVKKPIVPVLKEQDPASIHCFEFSLSEGASNVSLNVYTSIKEYRFQGKVQMVDGQATITLERIDGCGKGNQFAINLQDANTDEQFVKVNNILLHFKNGYLIEMFNVYEPEE